MIASDLTSAFRIEFFQQGLVFSHAGFRLDPDDLVLEPDGDVVREELDIQTKLPDHREDHPRVLDGADPAIVEEAIPLEGVHQPPQGFLLLQDQGRTPAPDQVRGRGQSRQSPPHDHSIIFHIHFATS